MEDKGRDLNRLAEVVAEALRGNEKVMSLMAEMRERGDLDADTLLRLYIKIGDLLQVSLTAVSHSDLDKEREPRKSVKAAEPQQAQSGARETIDGRDLSRNEIAFQEWVAERFDEYDWLKKFGMIW